MTQDFQKKRYDLEEVKRLWRQEPDDNMVFRAANQDIEEYPPEIQTIIKEEAERRHAIQPIQSVPNNRATHSSNTESRAGMRIHRKYLIVSVVFLAAAFSSGYFAFCTQRHKHLSPIMTSPGEPWSTDEELVAWGERRERSEERARRLVPSYEPSPLLILLGHKAEIAEARKRLEAKHRKVAAFALCSIATGVLGVGFLHAGLRSRGDPSGSPIENAENDRPPLRHHEAHLLSQAKPSLPVPSPEASLAATA